MAEAVKISIPKDEIVLEVNDNGETVILPVSDERFSKKLIDFANHIAVESEKMNFENADITTVIDMNIRFHEMMKEEFNKLFGDRAYEKVYGEDVLVGAEYVLEFIDQCIPYIQKYAKKREKRFNKYSANRVGSSL